jgi:hypothetical protein
VAGIAVNLKKDPSQAIVSMFLKKPNGPVQYRLVYRSVGEATTPTGPALLPGSVTGLKKTALP